jgi:hypothetical protein
VALPGFKALSNLQNADGPSRCLNESGRRTQWNVFNVGITHTEDSNFTTILLKNDAIVACKASIAATIDKAPHIRGAFVRFKGMLCTGQLVHPTLDHDECLVLPIHQWVLRERETRSKLKSESYLLIGLLFANGCDLANAITCIARWHGLAGVMVCSFWFVGPDSGAGLPGAGAGLTMVLSGHRGCI